MPTAAHAGREGSAAKACARRHHHVFASTSQAAPAAGSCKCIKHKLRHLQHKVEHEHTAEAAVQLEGSVQGAVQRIIDVGKAQVLDAAKLHMSQPMCKGGMSLIKLTPEVQQASYLT